MPTVTSKTVEGQSAGSVVLSDRVFAAKLAPGLMHQAVHVERVNSRQDTRDTKTRAEVAGGGKKPYRQKGTGRARQGSITAPHYRHGGIVFGPHPRDLSRKMTKKARRVAVASALTVKASEDAVTILESLAFETISTKRAATVLRNIGVDGKALIVLSEHSPNVHKSFRNIPGVIVRVAPAFSVRDVIDSAHIVVVRSALTALDAIWGSASEEAIGS